MSRQDSRQISSLAATINGSQIDIDPIGNGTSPIDDMRVLLVKGADGGVVGQVQSDWNQTNTSDPSYIKNKPTIPAAQVQSDWNQTNTSAKDYIKNKPTIPAAQIQSDWNQTNTAAKDYIKNKPSFIQQQANWNQTNTSAVDYIKSKPSGSISFGDIYGHSADFDLNTANQSVRLELVAKVVKVKLADWSDGPVYENIVAIPNSVKILEYFPPIISPIGSNIDTPASASEKADFNLLTRVKTDGETHLLAYASTLPSADFYILVTGFYFMS